MHEIRLLQIENDQGSMIEDFKELFIKMINLNPLERPSIEEVC